MSGTLPTFMIDKREGTVTGPAGTVRLEPRVMEVLAVLADRGGHVVPRDELLDKIWPGVVVTEYSLNRCVYRLRQALDSASDVSGTEYIETLPKRGYRLLANVGNVSASLTPLPVQPLAVPPAIPYVVGQWVRGDRFYGRSAQMAEILHGQRGLIWLLGTRRSGKTSLLKQIELLSTSLPEPRDFAIYWDFQGVDTPAELHLNFADALIDAEENLQRIGIDPHELMADDLFVSLDGLRRQLRARGLNLLLLCDEVEELLGLQREDPSLLRKLRHALQSRDGIRTVLASTIRLWELTAQTDDTSPFLHGFTPPVYIDRLNDDEARALVHQAHLRPEEQPDIAEAVVDTILQHCDNHPYLLQLVCKRYIETGDLDEATGQVATDRMVSYFFSVDFDMLSLTQQQLVRAIANQPGITRDTIRDNLSVSHDELDGAIRQLASLGFIHRDARDGFSLANYFFQRWLSGDENNARSIPEQPQAAIRKSRSRNRFLAELKHRKVIRVAIAYVVVAWVLLQLADTVFEFLEVPNWAGKLLLVLLVLGLPISLLLAWAFELTPGGIAREHDIDRQHD